MARVDARRTGRAEVELPRQPRVLWRLRVSGLIRDVAVGAHGSIAVATTDGRLIEVDPNGRLRTTRRLGAGVLAGPVLTSNGTRIVVTTEGNAVAIRPNGAVIWTRTVLPRNGSSAPSPLPDDLGAVVVGFDDRLVRLEPDGAISGGVTLSEAVRTITADGTGSIYAVGDLGSVFRWKQPDVPTFIGRFSAGPTGEAALVGTSLIAVVNHQRLESLSLESGARRLLLEGALTDTIIVFPSEREIAIASRDGMLFRYDLATASSATHAIPSASPAFGKASTPGPLLLLTDPTGAVAAAGAGRGLSTVDPKGAGNWLELPECGEPVACVPHASGRLLVACQSGLLVLVRSDAERAPGGSP